MDVILGTIVTHAASLLATNPRAIFLADWSSGAVANTIECNDASSVQ